MKGKETHPFAMVSEPLWARCNRSHSSQKTLELCSSSSRILMGEHGSFCPQRHWMSSTHSDPWLPRLSCDTQPHIKIKKQLHYGSRVRPPEEGLFSAAPTPLPLFFPTGISILQV